MSIKYENLQPWVDMLIDALENRGSSSSGIPDILVYPYAEKYRLVLKQIRNKELSLEQIEHFLNDNYNQITIVTIQPHRIKDLLSAISVYFHKEYMQVLK